MELPPNRIEALRLTAGLSRVQVAALCGVKTEVTVARWERRETSVPDSAKELLAREFKVSIEYLMGWDRQPSKESRVVA